MSTIENEWLVIYNPVSGGGRAKRDKEKILSVLQELKISYQLAVTEHHEHAIELTRNAIAAGHRKIMGIGGDGTVNEIVNGIFAQQAVKTTDIAFAFIPVGTGNDWIRTIGIPNDYVGAAKNIKLGNYFFQDVGVVSYYEGSEKKQRYFVNVAGMGYDAMVAASTNRKTKGGKALGKSAYMINLLRCLFNYKMTRVSVTIDNGDQISDTIFSLNVGICKYNGNGMMQVPNAVPDDGLLDVTMIHELTRMQVIKNTGKLYDGSFVENDFVTLHTGSSVKISSEPAIYLETDGESLGHSPFEFSLVHHGLKIISTIRNRQL